MNVKGPNEYCIEGDKVYIKLTQGKEAIIDLADLSLVAPYRWYAQKGRYTFYAYSKSNSKYKNKLTMLHTLILNTPKDMETDHIDGNGLNNSRSNLRIVTTAQNARNRRKPVSGKVSQYKGVTKHFHKFRAIISYRENKKKKNIHIGLFASEHDAARAYNAKAVELFGEHACLNIIQEDVVENIVENAIKNNCPEDCNAHPI